MKIENVYPSSTQTYIDVDLGLIDGISIFYDPAMASGDTRLHLRR